MRRGLRRRFSGAPRALWPRRARPEARCLRHPGHKLGEAAKRYVALAVRLQRSSLSPRKRPRAVVDLYRLAVGQNPQDDQVLGLTSESDRVALSRLYFDEASVLRFGVITLRRRWN